MREQTTKTEMAQRMAHYLSWRYCRLSLLYKPLLRNNGFCAIRADVREQRE